MTISQSNFDSNQFISIAEAIATARRTAGYSLEDLATTTGLTVEELEALESGQDVDPAHLKRAASALQLSQLTP